jgi:5-methylcytosine-specific restriction endonuclease McrA
LRKKKETFLFIMKVCGNVFAEDRAAFRVWQKQSDDEAWAWNKQISLPLWDSMYMALAELMVKYPRVSMYTKCKKELQMAAKALFEEHNLMPELQKKSKTKHLERKELIKRVLDEVLEEANPNATGPREFSNREMLIPQLYQKQGGFCTRCEQTLDIDRIMDGRYAHIDHIQPYSKGGVSEAENAALVHSECNLEKGSKTDSL